MPRPLGRGAFTGGRDLGCFLRPDPRWKTVAGERYETFILRELREAPLARITSLQAAHDYLAMVCTRENRLMLEQDQARAPRRMLLPGTSHRPAPLPPTFTQTHGTNLDVLQGRTFSLSGGGEVRAVLPATSLELIDLGQALRNCVGGRGYIENAAKGRTLLVALHDASTGAPLGLLEIKNGRLVQAVGERNKKLGSELFAVAEQIRDEHSLVGIPLT